MYGQRHIAQAGAAGLRPGEVAPHVHACHQDVLAAVSGNGGAHEVDGAAVLDGGVGVAQSIGADVEAHIAVGPTGGFAPVVGAAGIHAQQEDIVRGGGGARRALPIGPLQGADEAAGNEHVADAVHREGHALVVAAGQGLGPQAVARGVERQHVSAAGVCGAHEQQPIEGGGAEAHLAGDVELAVGGADALRRFALPRAAAGLGPLHGAGAIVAGHHHLAEVGGVGNAHRAEGDGGATCTTGDVDAPRIVHHHIARFIGTAATRAAGPQAGAAGIEAGQEDVVQPAGGQHHAVAEILVAVVAAGNVDAVLRIDGDAVGPRIIEGVGEEARPQAGAGAVVLGQHAAYLRRAEAGAAEVGRAADGAGPIAVAAAVGGYGVAEVGVAAAAGIHRPVPNLGAGGKGAERNEQGKGAQVHGPKMGVAANGTRRAAQGFTGKAVDGLGTHPSTLHHHRVPCCALAVRQQLCAVATGGQLVHGHRGVVGSYALAQHRAAQRIAQHQLGVGGQRFQAQR